MVIKVIFEPHITRESCLIGRSFILWNLKLYPGTNGKIYSDSQDTKQLSNTEFLGADIGMFLHILVTGGEEFCLMTTVTDKMRE